MTVATWRDEESAGSLVSTGGGFSFSPFCSGATMNTMNNNYRGFVVPALIAFVGVLLAVGGYYLADRSVAPAPQKPDASAEPITTMQPQPTTPDAIAKSCVRGGCSGQLCVEERAGGDGFASTCEYRAEYACYQRATCERQATGSCGWTQTAELSACLANPPRLEGETTYEIYTVYPGFVSPETYAEFQRTKKTCIGRSEPIPGDPRLADGPSLAKCYGYLE